MPKKVINNLYITLLLIFGLACQDNSPGSLTDPVSFSNDIAPFLENNCTACHYGGRQSPNLHDSVSYKQLLEGGYVIAGDAANSPLIIQLESDHPEKGILQEGQLLKIRTWIIQGALNN